MYPRSRRSSLRALVLALGFALGVFGTVLQTAKVIVDRGRTQKADLGECLRRFKR